MNPKYGKLLNKIQLITINSEGDIIFNDNSLFPEWREKVSIYDVHLFFDIIHSVKDKLTKKKNEIIFSGVHFEQENGGEKICDVKISEENSELDIFIFDYTEAYRDLHVISQERNESIIKAQELEVSNKSLKEKEEFKNRFIANVNHELVTPLTSIKGFVDLLNNTKLDYEQEEILKFIKSESEHLHDVFNDMLDISQIESGQFKLKKETFNFVELLNTIKLSYEKLITANDTSVVFFTQFDSKINPLIRGDKTRLYQIITNLLNNAIKFTYEGSIKFSVLKLKGIYNKQEIEIRVKDTGQGIFKENQEEIFETFSQIGETINGIGLGLNITKGLVSLMGGTIKVKSEIGEGTEFIINLSLPNGKVKDNSTLPAKSYTLPKGEKYRVLIVENRLNTQYLIMKLLLKHGSFFIDAVTSAEDALKYIENKQYDLIISDIKLPQMSGLKLAKKIRNYYGDSSINKTVILGLSGIPSPTISINAISSGMDAFISKPFSEEALINKIIRLLLKKKQNSL